LWLSERENHLPFYLGRVPWAIIKKEKLAVSACLISGSVEKEGEKRVGSVDEECSDDWGGDTTKRRRKMEREH